MKNASYSYKEKKIDEVEDNILRYIKNQFHLFRQESKIIEILPSNNKIEWLKGWETLFIFYELLLKYKYIDCNWDFFRIHFTGTGDEMPTERIIFLKETNQLPYIMKSIENGGFISKCKQKHIRLAQHFLDKFGNSINTGVLRASLNKSVGEKNKKFIDENIIDELKKYKSVD